MMNKVTKTENIEMQKNAFLMMICFFSWGGTINDA